MRDQIIKKLPTITRKINGALTLDKMLRVALKETLKAFGAQGGAILLFNRSHEIDEFMWSEIQGEWLNENKNASATLLYLAAKVSQNEKIVYHPDMTKTFNDPSIFSKNGPRSLLCVPIENEKHRVSNPVLFKSRGCATSASIPWISISDHASAIVTISLDELLAALLADKGDLDGANIRLKA